ncbi:MAG: monooxygenase, partial [Bradyrhizobium sp.]
KRQDRVLAASRWTNIMLQPPSEPLGMLIGTMSQNQALANEFTENFNYPDRQWDGVSTPERIHAWIARMSSPAEPVRAIA